MTALTDAWGVFDMYFRDHMYPFTQHHVDSFREFLRTHIPETIRASNPITMIKDDSQGQQVLRVEVYIGGKSGDQVFVERPQVSDSSGKPMLLTPQDARIRDLTYQGRLLADVTINFYLDGADAPLVRNFPMTCIADLPIMLHSEPCILHSQGPKVLQGMGECPMDQGGYFVVEGKEKVFVSREIAAPYRLHVRNMPDDSDMSLCGTICCRPEENDKQLQLCLARSGLVEVSLPSIESRVPLGVLFRALGVTNDRQITELVCGTVQKLPPQFSEFIRPSLAFSSSICYGEKRGVYSTSDAVGYLKQLADSDFSMSALHADVFPHIDDPVQKAVYLGYLVNRLMRASLGLLPVSDTSGGYISNRLEASGSILANSFHKAYATFATNVSTAIEREYYSKQVNVDDELVRYDNIGCVCDASIITDALHALFASEAESIERTNFTGFLSHLRRVLCYAHESGEDSPPCLHATEWGMMCPYDVQKQKQHAAYVKSMSVLTRITCGTPAEPIYKCLDDLDVQRVGSVALNELVSSDYVKVFVNSKFHGLTEAPHVLVRAMRLFRRNALINPFVSVAWNIKDCEIHIRTEPGRPCRPLFILGANGELLFEKLQQLPRRSWFDAVLGSRGTEQERTIKSYYKSSYDSPFSLETFQHMELAHILDILERTQAAIEYLDVEEENTCMIATDVGGKTALHTHVEIHPCSILGLSMQQVPLANHDGAPCMLMHNSNAKHAVGVYATNFTKRFDKHAFIQHYPQRSIVTTCCSHYSGKHRLPDGCNTIVAITTFTGFNSKYGIILNAASVDRGMFHTTMYNTVTGKEGKVDANNRVVIANPVTMRDSGKPINGLQYARWSLLDCNGVITEEADVYRDQLTAVIGMLHVGNTANNKEAYSDTSIVVDCRHHSKVDKVFIAQQRTGNPSRLCKVRLRTTHKPHLGDVACSRHGLKGVIGMLVRPEDLPFTREGVVPDVIINPHAFPGCMPTGQLIETVMAKLCCLEGVYGDGTVFVPFQQEVVYAGLEERGFERHGNEVMYNGKTGQQIDTEIFIGPCVYDRLATETEADTDGAYVGEIEHAAMVSHGLSQTVKESASDTSDVLPVCRHCGTIVNRAISKCTGCGNTDWAVVQTPRDFKLIMQQLEAIGVQLRLGTEPLHLESSSDSEADETDLQSNINELMKVYVKEKDVVNIIPPQVPSTDTNAAGASDAATVGGDAVGGESSLNADVASLTDVDDKLSTKSSFDADDIDVLDTENFGYEGGSESLDTLDDYDLDSDLDESERIYSNTPQPEPVAVTTPIPDVPTSPTAIAPGSDVKYVTITGGNNLEIDNNPLEERSAIMESPEVQKELLRDEAFV